VRLTDYRVSGSEIRNEDFNKIKSRAFEALLFNLEKWKGGNAEAV